MLNEKEGVLAMGTARGIPGNQKAIDILTEANMISDFEQSILDIMADTKGIYQGPYFTQSTLTAIYTDVLERYGLETISSEEAAESLVRQVETAIEAMKRE